MKQRMIIETTVVVELDAQDVLAYVREKGLVPKGWQYYSAQVDGKGASEGCTLTMRHTSGKDGPPE